MTASIHRRLPAWFGMTDPTTDRPASLTPGTLSVHFSTARPLEVRLRVPLALACPDYSGPGTWAVWSCDRHMLKASALIYGSKFGIGDVCMGIPSASRHWMADLKRRGRRLTVVGTYALGVREFVADVDRLSPVGTEQVDVDAFLTDVLGGAAS